jgi:hypothetical protein
MHDVDDNIQCSVFLDPKRAQELWDQLGEQIYREAREDPKQLMKNEHDTSIATPCVPSSAAVQRWTTIELTLTPVVLSVQSIR